MLLQAQLVDRLQLMARVACHIQVGILSVELHDLQHCSCRHLFVLDESLWMGD